MLKLENLISELESRNYLVSAHDAVKNGVKMHGITVRKTKDERISPCIYLEQFEEYTDPVEAADVIERILANANPISIDPDNLLKREFVLRNAYLALQRSSDQNLLKRSCNLDGIEEYAYVRGGMDEGNTWSIKLLPEHLKISGLTKEEVFEAAEKNTFSDSEISIDSMTSILASLMPSEMEYLPESELPMFVVSNKSKTHGAVQILNSAVKEWAKEHDYSRLVVLPSSIHECIILPADSNDYSIEDLSKMVVEVNSSQVSAVDQLADRAFILDVA